MKRPAIFTDHGRTYTADTCVNVVRAVRAGQIRLELLARDQYPGRRLPRTALPGLKMIGFWDVAQEQDWGLDWHRNEGIEITLLESGRLGFGVDGQDTVLKPGDLTTTRPWQVHRLGDPNVTVGRLHILMVDVGVRRPHQAWKWPSWLVLSKSDLDELTGVLRQTETPVWQATSEVLACFGRIAHTVEGHRLGPSFSWLTLELNELFLLVLEMFRGSEVALDASLSSSMRTVELFLRDLADNHAHLSREWTVPRMAKQCGLSVTYFTHHCRQLTHMTPLQFLNHTRLEAATRFLRERPKRSVTSIAMACGFGSSQYFATVFRRHFGCTPRQFRDNGRVSAYGSALALRKAT